MLTLPNYQIGTQIYESANSLVYQGIRKNDNQPVILKVLKEDYPTPEELTRYRQEYEITHDLNVTGVIKVYGIEKYQNTLVIILEDFGGESLKQLMVDRPFNIKEFLPLAIAIVDSLGNIHAANIIHKDINPANIVWNQTTNQLKIIDFGISTRLPRENPTLKNPEQLEGTLAYISPEQTGRINRRIDARTDLYSLGVTFYELLTGRVPFKSMDSLELVHCHIAKNPPPIREINPNVPPILAALIMKLMAKNSEDRYQSAFGVKVDLDKIWENLAGLDSKNLENLNFELAQNDFSGRLQIPQKLYGREKEIEILLQAFERITVNNPSPLAPKGEGSPVSSALDVERGKLMLITGYSGVGKTALVYEIHKPMTEKRGYFAAGKFDQYQRTVPYLALTQAFNTFCDYLLTESAAQLTQWRKKILQVVGTNGQVLIDVIPHLELIVGQQPAVAQVGPQEAQNRFNLVLQNFMKAICQPEHPFILFIDDLQWADLASLNLLKLLLTDPDSHSFLIIGAYRDNEVDATHPLIMALDELQKVNVVINTIVLSNLSSNDVNTLLADTLYHTPSQTQPLTELVYQKTQGNAFFTREFVKSLAQQDLLIFDRETQKWQWALDQINAKDMTDNVVDLMVNKISQLSSETKAVLKLAACIGNTFDLKTLSIIAQQTPQTTLQHLWNAIELGFLFPVNDNYKLLIDDKLQITAFKFRHDRIQQAAYSLIAESEKKSIHLQIGRLLLANIKTEDLEVHIFEIVNQLNHGVDLISEQTERDELAQLNLQAGRKAKTSAAYAVANQYLMVGIELLSAESWQTHYDLTLALYESAAEVAYLISDFSQQQQLVEIVITNAQSRLDKVKVYEISSQAWYAQNRPVESVKTLLAALKLFGIRFPDNPSSSEIQQQLAETKAHWSHQPIKNLIHLPEMTEPNQLAIMRLLPGAWSQFLVVKPILIPFVACQLVNLSIKYGNAPISAFGYIYYGLVLCAMAEDIENGYQFGQLGIEMLKQFKMVKPYKAKILIGHYASINHWNNSLTDSLNAFLEAYQTGLETGDIEIVGYAAGDYVMYLYFSGAELTRVEKEMTIYREVLSQLKQINPIDWIEIYGQMALNLQGKAKDSPVRLIGDVFDEETRLPHFLKANNGFCLCSFYLNKFILYYLFYEYSQAVKNADLVGQYLLSFGSGFFLVLFYFYESLARLASYREAQLPEQEKILEKVAANQEKMQNWAKHAPMNFQHKYDLVEAEKARVLEQFLETELFYEKAIAGARENEYLQEEALAYELAAKFYLGRGMEKFAQTYMREAHHCYQRWGALAKVKHLEDSYPQLFQKPTLTTDKAKTTTLAPISTSETQYHPGSSLDLKSVIKASQILAGEIVLSGLLEKMMHIVIENAGAEIGFLLLPKQGQWFIEAQGLAQSDEVCLLQSFPLENQPIAQTVIHYVERTKKNVVLNNAAQEGQFTRDPYIIKYDPKSILCARLLHQGQLTGILYLENNLTTGAFTPERIELLNLLSSQIAISIENARLYTSITRFLPSEFLSLLDKKNIIDVQLGDQVEKEMSILFSDIRHFTSLSEKMTPQENFNFINAYLSQMEPIIAQHHGFIDKYIGDAIMALFPTHADDAVQSAIAMLKQLVDYNQKRQKSGLEPIAIGIGLNTGLLMLGTVGGENRMDGTVISDAVNLASRIEGMTKMYGAALLISQETYRHLSDVSQYAIRMIDRVKVKGKSEPVTVYEVFDGDAPHLLALKMQTRGDFENGLNHYRQKEFIQAIACFKQVLDIHANDKAALLYLNRCQHWQTVGVPDDWQGIEKLDSK